jgi:cyanate permease
LITGFLSTRMPVKWLTAATYALQGTGIAILSLAQVSFDLYLGAVIAGFVIGNIVMLPPLLLREAFGPAAYGRLYGFANIAFYTMAGLGSALAGTLRDLTGTYTLALFIFVCFDAAAALIVAFMPKTKMGTATR